MIGIDYGKGQTNIGRKTGIRYGVISLNNDVLQAWADSSEPDYGPATCPRCGSKNLADGTGTEYECLACKTAFDSDEAFPETPASWNYDGDGYVCTQSGDDSDIFVVKSPFYTLAAFCSPCAPGAGDLRHPTPSGVRTYCFGHDWFENGIAPYPVYRLDGTEVLPAARMAE